MTTSRRATRREPARRPVRILTTGGLLLVAVGSGDRTVAGRYWNAIRRFLETGYTDRLQDFEGETVAGHQLLTDPDLIEYYARRGELDFESIYGSVR